MLEKFLGHDIAYWLELQERVDTLGVANYLQEIADLRGKVSFYESRINELNDFKNK